MANSLPLVHTDSIVVPLSLNLGEHTLIVSADGTVEIADPQVALQLSADEVYRLFITLQTLFA